jgi:hypothetical protein
MQTHHRLDDVQMNAIDREHAKAHVRSAELTIDFVADAVAKTRLLSAAVRRGVINLAWRIQSVVVQRRRNDIA